ncbi:MAG: DUF6338 family protein [Terracidiphilus sp.]
MDIDIWSADKFTLFVIFFLPGFISMKVYDLMVPGVPREASRSLLEAISYSTLNFGVLFWLIAWIQTNDFYHRHFILYSLAIAMIMVAIPACWPFAYLKLASWQPIAKHFTNPIQKPWDYVFGKRNPYWIIVHLKNGLRIGGRFATHSFASSNPAEEQIYLEEVWTLDEEGRFLKKIEQTRGIIIMQNEIRAVEFFE